MTASSALGEDPSIHPTATVERSRLGRYTEVGQLTALVDVEFGDYSYVQHFADLMMTEVGKFVSIANNVRINASNHPMWRTSQHHFQYRASKYGMGEDDEAFFAWRRANSCSIGHEVWLGHGAVVLPGRSVGIGAVVGAGAVVTKDVAPYTIVAGNPAQVIRPRYEHAATSEAMQALAWWDWSHAKLTQALPDFQALSPEAFIEKWSGTR